MACHNPHSSKNSGLLETPSEELCQECHDDMMAGSFVHEAVSDGSCTDCHSPHASSVRALLLDEVPVLCKECHDVPDEMTTVLHTALSDGECTDCHQPHAGSLPKLLVGSYNNQRYPKGFNEEMYSLCFEFKKPSRSSRSGCGKAQQVWNREERQSQVLFGVPRPSRFIPVAQSHKELLVRGCLLLHHDLLCARGWGQMHGGLRSEFRDQRSGSPN